MGTEQLLKFDRAAGRFREVEVELGGADPNKRPVFLFSNSPLQAGDSVTLHFKNGFLINGVMLHTNTPTTLSLDIRAVNAGGLPATEAEKISPAVDLALSGDYVFSDEDLVGWIRAVEADSILVVTVKSVDGAPRQFTMQLDITETEGGIPILWFVADPESFEASAVRPPLVMFEPASETEEFPTYTHDPSVVPGTQTPVVVFDGGSEEQYPTYTQADPSDLVFEAGADEVVPQWSKYERTMQATGPDLITYVVTGLPAGLVAEQDNSVLTIKGIPTTSGGPTLVTVEATDRIGRTAVDTFNITISAATKVPVIESVMPGAWGIDTTPGVVYVLGYNFGDTAGTLTLNGSSLTVNSWSDTELAVQLVSGLVSGNLQVTSGGQVSNLFPVDIVE